MLLFAVTVYVRKILWGTLSTGLHGTEELDEVKHSLREIGEITNVCTYIVRHTAYIAGVTLVDTLCTL